MKSRLKKYSLFFIIIALLLSLAACGSQSSGIAGTYEGPEDTFIFANDGTMRLISGNTVIIGTYTAEENTLELMLSSIATKYQYSLNGNTMMLYSDGASVGEVYTKTDKGQRSVSINKSKATELNGIYVSESLLLDESYTFSENGEYAYYGWNEYNGTYEITDGVLLLYNEGTVSKYTFECTENELILFDETSILSDVLMTGTIYTNVNETSTNEGSKQTQAKLDLSGNEKKVAGTYEGPDETYIFAKDGTMRIVEGSTVILGAYSADQETIEMVFSGVSAKYEYTLNKDNLVMYESGSSTGIVYIKREEGQNTSGLKEYKSKSLNGIYESSGWLSNSMYAFSADGIYKYSTSYNATHGTYSVDGNTLLLNSEENNEKYTFEIDNGMVIFEDSLVLSTGTFYSDVTNNYDKLESTYNTALDLLKASKYDEAASKFASISGYFDSDDMANESYYQKGYQLYESEKYEEALEVFASIGNYKDSKEMIDLCHQVIDARNIEKFDVAITRKESTSEESLGAYYNTVFEFGMKLTNGGTEDITAMSATLIIRDYDGKELFSTNLQGDVSVPAGQSSEVSFNTTFKNFQDVTPSVVWAHLMDYENYTIDFNITSLSFNGRKVETSEWNRRIKESKGSAYSSNIVGIYESVSIYSGSYGLCDDYTTQTYVDSYVFEKDGTFTAYDYSNWAYNYDDRPDETYLYVLTGTYTVSGDSIAINIIDDGGAWHHFYDYTNFKIVNNKLVLYTYNTAYSPSILNCDTVMPKVDKLNSCLQ